MSIMGGTRLFLEKQCYTFIVLLAGLKPIFRGALKQSQSFYKN